MKTEKEDNQVFWGILFFFHTNKLNIYRKIY